MKLFSVHAMGFHSDYSTLIVAENEEKAIEIFKSRNDDTYYFTYDAYEINEVDGYKIVFHKGKKIVLTK